MLDPFSDLQCAQGSGMPSTLPSGAENFDMEAEDDYEAHVNSDEATMLDSVFYTCDVDRKGLVRVSTIIDYLRNLTGEAESSEIKGFLDDLSLLLDPTGQDIYIDARTYQEGVYRWVGDIKQRNVSDSPTFQPGESNQRNGKMVYHGTGKSSFKKNERALLSNTLSGDSLEEIPSWSSDLEESDIVEKITELQVLNKKLAEENSRLQQQVESIEESNNSLAQEVEKLRKKSLRYENLYEKAVVMEKDYVDLKTSVSDYENAKEQLTKKATQLEREVSVLQDALEECRQKVTEANMSEGLWKEQNKVLQQELADQKTTCTKLEELLEIKTQLLNESSDRLEYMSAVIAELTFANQMLKSDKNELEAELLEAKEEMSRISVSDDLHVPMLTSTPFHKCCPTLKEELKAEIGMSPDSASAVKAGEGEPSLEDEAFDVSSSSQNESALSDGARSISTNASMDRYSSVAHKIARKFKKRKEIALKQIEELVALDTTGEAKEKSMEIAKELEDEMEFFSSKISSLALAKQVAERRAAKLFILYRRVKAENKCLKDSKGKILQRLGNSLLTQEEMDKRYGVPLENSHDLSAECEKKFNEKNELGSGTNEQGEKSPASSSIKSKKPMQDDVNEVTDLKHLVESLEGRQHESDRRLFELEEQLEAKRDLCTKQEKKIRELEKAAGMPSLQNKELLEILAMLPSLENSTVKQEVVTLGQVKERLSEYISAVQSKIKRMGIRDSPDGGPVGCETENEVIQRYSRVTSKITPQVLAQSLEDNRVRTEHLKAQGFQTDAVSTTSSMAQTDLVMEDMDQLIECFNQEHDVNHNIKLPVFVEPEWKMVEEESFEAERDAVVLDVGIKQEVSKEGVGRISPQSRVAPVGEMEPESPTVDEVFKPNNPTLAVNGEEVYLTEPAERNDSQRLESWSSDFNDKDTSCSEDELSMKMRLRKKRLSDDSFDDRQRATSAASATSELSSSSASSKRGRRIGISAEPVRLPTWSELRELYKINQQLELEDVLQKDAKEAENSRESEPASSVDADNVSEDAVTDLPKQESTASVQSTDRLCSESTARPELRKQRSVTFSIPDIDTEDAQLESGSSSGSRQDLKSCMKEGTDTPPQQLSVTEDSKESGKVSSDVSLGTSDSDASPSSKSGYSKRSGTEGPPTFLTTFKSVTEITDIERKFNNAVLNFRTDQYTLQKRLDNQERARDVAESGMEKELERLTSAIKHLEQLSLTYDLQEAVGLLHKNTDILRRAGMKVSAQAEQHGCFQKEQSMSGDIEVMISYAEHMRLKIESIEEEYESSKRQIKPAIENEMPVEPRPPPSTEHRTPQVCGTSSNEEPFRRAFTQDSMQTETPVKSNGSSLYRLAKSLLHNPSLKDAATGKPLPPEPTDAAGPKVRQRGSREKRQVTYSTVASIIPEEIHEPSSVSSCIKSWSSFICAAFVNFVMAVAILTFILYIAVNYFEVDFDRLQRRFSEQVRILSKRYLFDPPEKSPL